MKYFVFDLNTDGSSKLFCEIIERPMGMKPSPVFLWIPGGGFTVCATEMGVPIQLSLATHGYSVFTMTYPVGENYRFPEVLVLMSKAILMIRAHAEEWNIDPNKIIIGGGSAGGFISAAYSALWNHSEVQKLTGCSNGENRPNALLTQNGLFNAYQQTNEGTIEVAVYDYIGKDMPPAFILHSADDTLVSVDQALVLAWNMSREKIPFSLFISDSGNHGGLQNHRRSIMETGKLAPNVDDWLPAALTFLENALGIEPGYEHFSMPLPPDATGKNGDPNQPPAGTMLQMNTGTYESGMVWGFAGTDADKLSWEK